VRLLLFFYLVLTLFVSGRMVFNAAIWAGVAFLIGSLVGFAGGSGMRGAFYRGQKRSAVIIGGALAFAGMALVFYSGVIVRVFGSTISGDLWVFVGFGLGFFAARPEDAGVQMGYHGTEDDVALGTIAPIAAGLAAGRLTAEQAEKQIRNSALIAPQAPALWQSMSAEEREELGLNFMRLAANPEFASRIEKQLEPIKNADPELWDQVFAQARNELGNSADGKNS
jgi:hypothetical protein